MKKLKKGSKIKTNDGSVRTLSDDVVLNEKETLKEWLYNDNDDKKGLEIDGMLVKLDYSQIDLDQFTNDFIDFVESKGMMFGGGLSYKNPYE